MSAAGLGLNAEAENEIDSVTDRVGTPEWMAPELLATTVPATWFELDTSTQTYAVDKQVPGLREAVSVLVYTLLGWRSFWHLAFAGRCR